MVNKQFFDQKDVDLMTQQATKLGIGVAIVSKDALENFIKKMSKDSKVSEKEARHAVTELIIESQRREKELQAKVKAVIKSAKESSPVVLKKDMLKLKAEIAELKQKLKLKKK
ncbi:MAG: hypothetical protein WC108_04450 [Bacteroidales bacterium]